MSEPRYSLIIPAHNEAARLRGTLRGYLDAFADSEVLLVLNGCTDQTERVAREEAGQRTNLRILRIDHAVGKGGAVRAGFLAAKAAQVGYVDADGATPPHEMRRLFDTLASGGDAVIASRWSAGSEVVVAQPVLRRLSSRIFNSVVRLLFGLPFRDTQCGAKVFSNAAIRSVSNSLEISNFAFDIDLLYMLTRAKYEIREVPTVWHDKDGSHINLPRASLEMLSAVLRLRLRHSLFRYVIPIFDRVWPTTTLRVRHGLSVLIVGLHDPQSPAAGKIERYLRDTGAALVRRGHRVHWLSAGFASADANATLDGITVRRVGTSVTARAAIPLAYARELRDRFDVVIEVQHGFPLLSPLFSFKPKICLLAQPDQEQESGFMRAVNAAFERSILRKVLPALYGSSRFIAISREHADHLARLGIPAARIDARPLISPEGDELVENDDFVKRFLDSVYTEVSREYSSYVLSGEEWAIVPHKVRNRRISPQSSGPSRPDISLKFGS